MNFSNKGLEFVDYLITMTDDVGIFQHSIYGVPDPKHGYTTDDNSRALILAVMIFESTKDKDYLKLITRYLSFMLYAQNDNGKFKNFMGYNRDFLEKEGSEDCFGRCLWALGRTISSESIPENIKRTCQHMMNKVLAHWPNLNAPRSKAYSIVGLSYIADTKEIVGLIDNLSMSLVEQYKKFKDGDWHWFEDSMTYGNAFFPGSLFRAYGILKKDILLEIAQESMNFLGMVTFNDFFFKPIGSNGWYVKGKTKAEYDEQPIEACEMLLSYIGNYELTKDKKYLDNAVKCFNWFLASNLPSTVAPVLVVIDTIARMFPLKTEYVPSVTELPTCQ